MKSFVRNYALPLALWVGFLGVIWAGSIYAGRMVETKVEHHEQENAYCYTAGKMFFVSIACVPKL